MHTAPRERGRSVSPKISAMYMTPYSAAPSRSNDSRSADTHSPRRRHNTSALVAAASGTVVKKIERQPKCSASSPPSTGPSDCPE